MLELFCEFGVHVTWATVGFLFFESKEDLLAAMPPELPEYTDLRLNPYTELNAIGKDEEEDPFHYAPSLVRLVRATPGQEIATHTFSHFYVGADGPSLGAFRADLRAARTAAQRLGVDIKSIVFPRNQISAPHLRICAEEGITAYRGNEADPLTAAGNGTLTRLKRLADCYFNLSGPCCGKAWLRETIENAERVCGNEVAADAEVGSTGHIISVPQSRFLRPYSRRAKPLEGLKLKRIEESLLFAARNGRIFHLWWHPHNFGSDLEMNLAGLRRILKYYRELTGQYDFQSRSMAEVAESLVPVEAKNG
jgi:peptidoglycan/xylan/chitin deacetylase (PgdA/CDA1 family)